MTPKRVAAYCRFSTDRQDQRSIDDQARRIRQLAAQRGFEVVDQYSDAAVSGSHTDRQDLQRLLADARKRRFTSVLVDDLSRLSRDLGDTWNLIYRDLAGLGVNVIDCTTGLASDARGARITFGAQALVNDFFLELVRTETHRGLEGRALAGFSAGGKTYGFTTIIEPNPPDPTHPRKLRIVHDAEAAVVMRIFEMFADGQSPKKIAAKLNEEGIPAPHDGGKGHKTAHGWGHTTIRHMVRNENYVGRWVWNRHKFQQIPGTNSYRHVPRPESEWVKTESEKLRVVPDRLWAKVQQRIGPRRTRQTARLGHGTKAGSMLAGVAKCGVCSGAYGVVSRRYKNGVGYATLGCGIHASRGEAVCANRRTISAKKLTHLVVETLRDPTLRDRIADAVKRRLAEPKKNSDLTAIEKQIAQAEGRVKNATEGLVAIGYSASLADAVKREETRLGQLRSAHAAASAPKAGKVAIHPAMVNRMLQELAACMEADPAQARTVLRFMPVIHIKPEGDRLRISGGFDIDALLEPEKVRGSLSRRDRD